MSVVNQKAKSMVLRVLRDPAVKRLNFGIATRYIKAGVYTNVAKAIERDEISVCHNAQMDGGAGGLYYPVVTVDQNNEYCDILVLSFDELGHGVDTILTRAQIIVHECTHAAFDMLKLPLMQHAEHEAGGYIAGALFAVAYMGQRRGRPEKLKFGSAIKNAAWQIALRIYYDDRVPQHYYSALDRAICGHGQYKDNALKFATNDGVGRKHKIGPPQIQHRTPMAFR